MQLDAFPTLICLDWSPEHYELHHRMRWFTYQVCWECGALPGEQGCQHCGIPGSDGFRDPYAYQEQRCEGHQ